MKHVFDIDCGILISKLIKTYTLNMQSILNANHTLIKFKNTFKTISDQGNEIKTQCNPHLTHVQIAKIINTGKDMGQFSLSKLAERSMKIICTTNNLKESYIHC